MKRSNEDPSVGQVKGVGPHWAGLLAKLGIASVRDALLYLPFRYEDRSHLKPFSGLRPDILETVSGTIVSIRASHARGRKFSVFEIILHDGSHYLKARWFNQPFMQKNFRVGQTVVMNGMVRINRRDMPPLVMDNPEYELLAGEADSLIHTGRIVPVYRIVAGMSLKQFRKIMFGLVREYSAALQDAVPQEIAERHHLPGLAESLLHLHFPAADVNVDELNSGRSRYHRRLAFDELFLLSLGLALLKKRAHRGKGISFLSEGSLRARLAGLLPFVLTSAQVRVMDQISGDMRSPRPMNRLLQGDVGSGKTVVALAAMLDAVEAGYQAVIMAPTGILAEQHFLNIRRMIAPLGLTVDLRTRGQGEAAQEHDGECAADIVVGTHALIQERTRFRKLGLVVIDEQHKFGVMQRALLRKKGTCPDVLVMTATPIPRTLALTLYGDLDYSIIDALPPGRTPVRTTWCEAGQREEIFNMLKSEIGKGRQAYVVYPAIEESETADLRSAVRGKEAFKRKFPQYRVALLHGRMKAEEREQVMGGFKRAEIDILVSTTVIEVGVDVPNATVMLIVHAERFGLSQLHQLRGRVGRGADHSRCILIAYPPLGEDARRRLEVMTRTNDGFRIAEKDLEIRGPGTFFGTRQAGFPELRNSDIVKDAETLESARREAFALVAEDGELRKFPFLKQQLDVFWKGRAELFRTG